MGWSVSAAILVAVASGSVQQPDDPILRPACKGIAVSLVAEASQVKVGDKPRFSVTVSNNTARSVRILDVQKGRRPDLEDSYFELFVIQGRRTVDVPIAISDPGPLSATDFLELRPGARVQFRHISYKRALQELPPGAYEAFILFWRDPMVSDTTRCRSTPASRESVAELASGPETREQRQWLRRDFASWLASTQAAQQAAAADERRGAGRSGSKQR